MKYYSDNIKNNNLIIENFSNFIDSKTGTDFINDIVNFFTKHEKKLISIRMNL